MMRDDLQGKITGREWADAQNYAEALARAFATKHGLLAELDDLQGEARLGLAVALDRYEPGHAAGARFLTFAHYQVQGRLYCYGRKRAQHRRLGTLSLDFTDESHEEPFLPAGLAEPSDESHEADVILRHTLTDAIRHLSPGQQEILRLRYRQGFTLQEVAAMQGISSARVWQRQQTALATLRELLG